MKDKTKTAIIIGIMCMLLTCAILIQLTTIKEATKIVGTQYAQEGLKDEVLTWKENYERQYSEWEKVEKELEQTRQEATTDTEKGKALEKELSNTNKLLGLTELTGTGLIVTLADNTEVSSAELQIDKDIRDYLIHDADIINVVNELNNAGAEAISINGQRLISTTSISCTGTVVTINGVKLSSPFKILAIGNPEALLGGVDRPGGYVEIIRSYGALAKVEKSNNITISKYNGTLTSKYIRNIK